MIKFTPIPSFRHFSNARRQTASLVWRTKRELDAKIEPNSLIRKLKKLTDRMAAALESARAFRVHHLTRSTRSNGLAAP